MRPRAAFSLVELLVVIATIATLVSISLPALRSGRESARAIVCAANAGQLQSANDFYATDHGGRWLPGAARFLGNLHRWHGARPSPADAFDPAGGPITPYLAGDATSARVRQCPSFADVLEAATGAGAGFEAGCGGYGYNNAFVGVERELRAGVWAVKTDETGSKRSRFERPAGTVGFTDTAFDGAGAGQGPGAGAGAGLIEYSFVEPRWWPDFPSFRPDPSAHFRHGGRASVAWLDGHVSAERRTSTWAGAFGDGAGAAAGLGWFGAHDDNSLFDYD